MRNIESQSGKGFKSQTLRAIDLFLDTVSKFEEKAKIFVYLENKGDIQIESDTETTIIENKNYTAPHSINNEEIFNTLINFLDVWVEDVEKKIKFGFYSSASIRPKDNFGLQKSILQYLKDKDFTNDIILKLRKKITDEYKTKYSSRIGLSNIQTIDKFNNSEWQIFFNQISWNFDLENNEELTTKLTSKIKDSLFFKDYDYYNGIEVHIINAFRDKLERKQESRDKFVKAFGYDDFGNIVKSEILKRLQKLQKNNFGSFRKISQNSLPPEINIRYENFTFIQKEKSLITSIRNQLLKSNDENFAYIKSQPGIGKTILSLEIGFEFEKRGYLILFISLNQEHSELVKSLKEINAKNDSVVCILTDCHLNFQMFKKIHLYKNEYPKIKFIFEFRYIYLSNLSLEENIDYIEKRNVKEIIFEEIDFINKYKGIIQNYNPDLILTNKEILKIIELTGRNFVILNHLLIYSNADKNKIINLNNTQFVEYIYYSFFKESKNDLRFISTIYQYEISVYCEEYVEKKWFIDFLNRNLIISENSNFFRLYHSDFAAMLVKTYYLNNEFDRENKQRYEFEQFKYFILNANNDYTQLYDIFDRLYSNNANTIITNLLNDNEIQNYTLEFYKNPINFKNTNFSNEYSKLLIMLYRLLPQDIFNKYFSVLIINNDEFVNLYAVTPQANLSLVEISFLIRNCSEKQKEIFKNIVINIITINYKATPFIETCEILYKLHKKNNYLSPIFNNKFGKDELINKALKEKLIPLSKGINKLSKIMDHQFIEEIYSKIDKEILMIDSLKDNIKDTLVAYNILKKFGYQKTYENFIIKNIEIDFSLYSLYDITEIMLEIMKFSTSYEVKDSFSNKLSLELLIDKIKFEELPIIANQLILLFRHCIALKDTIIKVIQSISIEDFLTKIKFLTLSEIEIIINKFSKIENEPQTHTKKLLRSIKNDWFNHKFETSSVANILNSMVLLFKIDEEFVRVVYNNFSDSLSEQITDLSFEEQIKILPYLFKFSPNKAFQILHRLINNSSQLRNWFYSLNYQAISTNLKFFQDIEDGSKHSLNGNIIYSFFCSFEDDFYINKILDFEFGLLCNFSLKISRINKSFNRNIVRIFSKISNIQLGDKINSSTFLKDINGLVNLYQIDKSITNNVFNYSFNSFIKIANKTNISNFTIGLNTLRNRIPEYSYKIYNNENIKIGFWADQCRNADLTVIKKYAYFLKNINFSKTKKFIDALDSDNIVFKFTNDRSFDKASNLLRDLHSINQTKIENILELMNQDDLYNMCLSSRFKIVIQGLSKISEINANSAKSLFLRYKHQIDINNELLQISNFQNLSQKLREIVKIEGSKITSNEFINKIGEEHFVHLAKKLKYNQKRIGLTALMRVDSNFSKYLAKIINFDF